MSKGDRIKVKRAVTSLVLMKDEMARVLDESFSATIEAMRVANAQPSFGERPEVEILEEDVIVEEYNNEKA
ncbi:hypothetical protein [Klebsiella phage YC1]|nr:hypothetical protein [Klebsiella phage YC1]